MPREIFGDLSRELGEALVVPVLIGSAARDNGVLRLLKALRHEVPEVAKAAERGGIKTGGDAVVKVLKTFHGGQGGKLSLVRVLSGSLKDNQVLHGPGGDMRIGGIFALSGSQQVKKSEARAGDTVALARMDNARTGETSFLQQGAGRPRPGRCRCRRFTGWRSKPPTARTK